MVMDFEKRYLVLFMLLVCQETDVAKAFKAVDGHIHVAVEVVDFRIPLGTSVPKFDTNGTRKCCKSRDTLINICNVTETCHVWFALCFGRSSSQWPMHCEGTLVKSSEMITDSKRAKFPVFNIKSWNENEKFTVYMIVEKTIKDTSPQTDKLIYSFTGSIAIEVDTNFWTSKRHMITLTKCASVTLGIRIFCESNYYGQNCDQFVHPDIYHHILYIDGSMEQVLDCNIIGSSVINIYTNDPYVYSLSSLKVKLIMFLVDKVCSASTNVVNVKIDNVRYTRGKLRVAFNGHCRKPITDLEVHHALNYMTKDEIYKYFGNYVERIDETPNISKGRFNIMYRVLDISLVENSESCEGKPCSIVLRFSYRNQSVSSWTVTPEHDLNYCFRGLENMHDKQTNTEHIVSEFPAQDTVPLEITVDMDLRNGTLRQSVKFEIPVLNYTEDSVTGNSYKRVYPAEMERTDKSTGLGIKIALFVWCSTGYTGKRCEENCQTEDTNCNYEKCIHNGEQHKYAYNIHCNNGHCNESTHLCDCEPGYIGPICQAKIDFCKIDSSDNPCANGNCINHANGFTCECNQYFTGKLCEIMMTEYANVYMSKQGVFNMSNALATKSPSNNEIDIDQCRTLNNCSNGTSISFKDTIKCSCDIGFTDDNCMQVDYCSNNPCMHDGICKNNESSSTFTCECRTGFHGITCCMNNECTDDFCLNNATCINTASGNIACLCKKGYTGQFCEVNLVNTTCENKMCTNETKCNVRDNATHTCDPANTSSHSSHEMFVKLLPAYKPSGIDDGNITESLKTLLGNITHNCGNAKIPFDVFRFANGSSNIYIGVLCDGKILSPKLIGQQLENYHTDEIIEILHFIPTDKNDKQTEEVTNGWIEENWILLIGIIVAVVAMVIGTIVSLYIIYGLRPKRKTIKGKINPHRNSNIYVSSREAFASGKRGTLDSEERKNPHIINSSNLKSRFVTDSLTDGQDSLQRDDIRFNDSVYYTLTKQPMPTDVNVKNTCHLESLAAEGVNIKGWDEKKFETGLYSRDSYNSKMTFWVRNPIYDMKNDN